MQRHEGLPALVTLLLFAAITNAVAGGGWVSEPGAVNIRLGYDWKYQPDAQRLDTEGERYRAASNMTHDYRFFYLSGDVGIYRGLEGSVLMTYLWASETVDSTSEDPSHHYHGWSDMWVGLKYRLLEGDYPIAIGATARLPNLYEASSVRNGQLLTEITGLLKHDYEVSLAVSHSFDEHSYGSATTGFRFKEGAATNQVLLSGEVGGRLPVADDRISVKVGLNGVFSVGEPEPSTSKDRFSGLTLESGTHFFDFNDASYLQPQLALGVRLVSTLELSAGYSHIVWGHSTVVYRDVVVQIGYSF